MTVKSCLLGGSPPRDSFDLVLLHWGTERPFELLTMARLLEVARSLEPDRVRWRWLAEPGEASPIPSGVDGCIRVLAQAPPSRTPFQLAEAGQAQATIMIGRAAAWFAARPEARGRRVALHWSDATRTEGLADVVASPAIVESADAWTTCSGGFAVVDLSLHLLQAMAGPGLALRVMDLEGIECARELSARQRAGVRTRALSGGALTPKLAEAMSLMESNLEEPLQTPEIARLVQLSRRQLERIFKQNLGVSPFRHYLGLRLNLARKLLRETRHPLLQVGLMCGFSSGGHFSTSYASMFGLSPGKERQVAMARTAAAPADEPRPSELP